MDNTLITPGELWLIVKRSKWGIIFIFTSIVSITAAVAVLMPAIYRSDATIMIESQHIPTDFVMSTVTTAAAQRVESIKQRVLSFSKLSEIIKKYELYPELRKKQTLEKVVSKMRKDIKVKMIMSKAKDKSSSGTTFFILSYEGRNPQSVLQITNTPCFL